MPVEIEAKMHVRDLEQVRRRLREVGATFVGDMLERNTFYDTEDRELLAGDRGLRVRTALLQQTGVVTSTMTYKGPRHHGPLKSRDELETTVGDAEQAGGLLEALGFGPVLSFEKKRQTWDLADCRVELDELPYIGSFVEIEGATEGKILELRNDLGLADASLIKTSYVAMLKTYLQENKIISNEVRF